MLLQLYNNSNLDHHSPVLFILTWPQFNIYCGYSAVQEGSTQLYLFVLEVRRELIAVRQSLAAFALLLLLLTERQAGWLVSAALSPGQASWAGGRYGRAALKQEESRG